MAVKGLSLFVTLTGLIVAVSAQHPCLRRCHKGQAPMKCPQEIVLDWYTTMSKACKDCPHTPADCDLPNCIPGDGNRRPLIAMNKQMPGPPILACKGDTIQFKVTNMLVNSESTTVHFHGQHVKGTPWADGTAFVTQCPIERASYFLYEFTADPSGTHIYHSHSGVQMADGLVAGIIIWDFEEDDPNFDEYDHDCVPGILGHCEHVIATHEWHLEPYLDHWAVMKHWAYDNALEVSSLVNGRMKRYPVTNDAGEVAYVPYQLYPVAAGKRYRFRALKEGHMTCPFKFSVDGHKMKVIAADGHDVKPFVVDTFILYSGERYDFVLTADQPVGNYWVKMHAMQMCRQVKPEPPHAYGVLRYDGAPAEDPAEADMLTDRQGTILQPIVGSGIPSQEHGPGFDYNEDTLRSVLNEDFTTEVVDKTFYMALEMTYNDNTRFQDLLKGYPINGANAVPSFQKVSTAVMNNITFLIPNVPVLTQPEDLDFSLLCSKDTLDMATCENELCNCVHYVAMDLNDIVEVIMFNVDDHTPHPMHTHGYAFRVLSSGRLPEDAAGADGDWHGKSSGEIYDLLQDKNENDPAWFNKNLIDPSYRDTVTVHAWSYVVVRFLADNPGYWLLHCHTTDHLEGGQILLYQVGAVSDIPTIPNNFPRCGSFEPKWEEEFCPTETCSRICKEKCDAHCPDCDDDCDCDRK